MTRSTVSRLLRVGTATVTKSLRANAPGYPIGPPLKLRHRMRGAIWRRSRAPLSHQFLWENLINDANLLGIARYGFYYGPWIGGLQTPGSPEPGSNSDWEWVNGEGTFAANGYSNWRSGEPNDFGAGTDENRVL